MAMLKNQRVWVRLFQVSEFFVFTQRPDPVKRGEWECPKPGGVNGNNIYEIMYKSINIGFSTLDFRRDNR